MRDPGLDGGRPGRCSGWWSHCCRELPPAEGRWDRTGVGGAARPPGATAGRRVQAPSTPHCWPALLGPGLTLWDHSSCMGLFGFWHILGGRGGGPRSGAAPHAWLLGLRPCASRGLRPVPTSPCLGLHRRPHVHVQSAEVVARPGAQSSGCPRADPTAGTSGRVGGLPCWCPGTGPPPGPEGPDCGYGIPWLVQAGKGLGQVVCAGHRVTTPACSGRLLGLKRCCPPV